MNKSSITLELLKAIFKYGIGLLFYIKTASTMVNSFCFRSKVFFRFQC